MYKVMYYGKKCKNKYLPVNTADILRGPAPCSSGISSDSSGTWVDVGASDEAAIVEEAFAAASFLFFSWDTFLLLTSSFFVLFVASFLVLLLGGMVPPVKINVVLY